MWRIRIVQHIPHILGKSPTIITSFIIQTLKYRLSFGSVMIFELWCDSSSEIGYNILLFAGKVFYSLWSTSLHWLAFSNYCWRRCANSFTTLGSVFACFGFKCLFFPARTPKNKKNNLVWSINNSGTKRTVVPYMTRNKCEHAKKKGLVFAITLLTLRGISCTSKGILPRPPIKYWSVLT